jgi:hypothetical protein
MMRSVLLLVAALATVYATASFRRAERRRYRAEVWERRDREAGQR